MADAIPIRFVNEFRNRDSVQTIDVIGGRLLGNSVLSARKWLLERVLDLFDRNRQRHCWRYSRFLKKLIVVASSNASPTCLNKTENPSRRIRNVHADPCRLRGLRSKFESGSSHRLDGAGDSQRRFVISKGCVDPPIGRRGCRSKIHGFPTEPRR